MTDSEQPLPGKPPQRQPEALVQRIVSELSGRTYSSQDAYVRDTIELYERLRVPSAYSEAHNQLANVREAVQAMREALSEATNQYKVNIDEARNSGDGSYRP